MEDKTCEVGCCANGYIMLYIAILALVPVWREAMYHQRLLMVQNICVSLSIFLVARPSTNQYQMSQRRELPRKHATYLLGQGLKRISDRHVRMGKS